MKLFEITNDLGDLDSLGDFAADLADYLHLPLDHHTLGGHLGGQYGASITSPTMHKVIIHRLQHRFGPPSNLTFWGAAVPHVTWLLRLRQFNVWLVVEPSKLVIL